MAIDRPLTAVFKAVLRDAHEPKTQLQNDSACACADCPAIKRKKELRIMRSKLLGFIPKAKWVPSDLPSDQSSAKPKAPKPKLKTRITFALKPSPSSSSSSVSRPNHGALRRRSSALSVTNEPDAALDVRTKSQTQSIFFTRLPLELRRMVYEYVFGKETLHLTLGAKRKFGHFICEERSDEYTTHARKCGCRVLVGGKESMRLDNAGVRMLRSCRRMYSEAIPYLYRSHAFSLLHVTHLLYLPSRIPQPRLDTIRTLNLRWAIRALPYLQRSGRLAYREDTANWERGWAILASLKGLRELFVVLVDPSPQHTWQMAWMQYEEELLLPISEVIIPKTFEVVLPYQSCVTNWDMGESSVIMRRPVEEENAETE